MIPRVKFLALKSRDKLLFIKCLFVVVVARLGLTFIGYARMRSRMPQRPEHRAHENYVRRIAWCVSSAAALVPKASCLTQALAVQYMLARSGHPTTIRIGVAEKDGRLAAHAWLISDDEIIIGGTEAELDGYTPLTDLPHTA